MWRIEKWQRLSVRERVLAGGAVAVFLVAVLRYGIVGPYLSYTRRIEESIASEAAHLEQLLQQVSQGQQVEHSLAQLRRRHQRAVNHFIPGETPALAAARLQERLQYLASQSRARIVTTQVLQDQEVGGFQRTGIQLTLRGNTQAVANFLAAVEYDAWWLVIERLDIRGQRYRRRSRGRPSRHSMLPRLAVTVEVKGFIQEVARADRI